MPKPRSTDDLFARRKPSRQLPFAFILEELAELGPTTRPMFGCHAVYVEDKIVFILRERRSPPEDDGVWIATTEEHHASLKRELPGMRSIRVLASGGVTGWQVLPVEADDFEESALRACAMVKAGDQRVGKVPKGRRPRKARRPAGAAGKRR